MKVRRNGEFWEKFRADPESGSSRPDAALKPPTCPVKLSTKNQSDAPRGGGLIPEPPLPQAVAKATRTTEASIWSLDLKKYFEPTLEPGSLVRPTSLSQRITTSPLRRNPSPFPDLAIR